MENFPEQDPLPADHPGLPPGSLLPEAGWTRETAIEALRLLEAQKIADGNMRPLSSRDVASARRSEEAENVPSWKEVNKHVGTNDDLQRELGRVTTKIALAWETQQWVDNAKWGRDILAQAGVKLVTKPHIDWLASAGLMPNTRAIQIVWGSVPEYRKRTGIEPEPAGPAIKLEAKNWDRTQSAQKGREYAAYLGRDFGFPLMPSQDDIERGVEEGRTPSYYQLVKIHDSFEQYRADIGFVTNDIARTWTDQQWKDNYEWLKAVWGEQEREITSIRSLLRIASKLHISPTVRAAIERWGNLTNYSKHVGHESELIKRSLSSEGATRAAIQVIGEQKRPLKRDDVEANPDLGWDMIKDRFGGIGKLNFRLGFITDARFWDKDMLLWWGVTTFIPRAGHLPRPEDLAVWRDNNRGPPPTKILKEFNGSLDEFHTGLEESRKWLTNQIYRFSRATYRREVPRLNEPLLRQAINRNHTLFHPDRNLEPHELEFLYQLQNVGVDLRFISGIMQTGISFTNPEPRLRGLAETLSSRNVLNSTMLRRLEPYIIGLAPPKVEMSWVDFIADYRR